MEEKHFGPVWFIPGENRGKYPFCHSIYIEGDGVLIDPASQRERLIELGEHPGVKEVWLTHAHEDHFMHLDLFEGLSLCVAEEDTEPLVDIDHFLDAYGIYEDFRDFWRSILEEQFHFRPRKPTRFLRDGDVIYLDSVTVEVLGTPGHTPGHLSFFFREPEVLFLGDYDLTGFGPWYGDVNSNIEETISSVERLRKIPAKAWLTSHETGIFEEEPGEIWDNYLNVISEREEKLMAFLEEPRTLEDIVGAAIIYRKPREPKAFFEFGESGHMKKHLEGLMNKGAVAMEGERYFKIA